MTPARKILLPLMALAALILSACRVVVDTKINVDGSGELRSSVVFSAQEKQNFVAAPGNEGKSICDNLKGATPTDATFVEEEKSGETFCTTERAFANLQELRDDYSRIGNLTVNQLDMAFGKIIFDVQVDSTPKSGNEQVPSEWRVTVPGEIGNNNADSIDGQTLIWKIEPGTIRTLHVESGSGVGIVMPVLIGGLILLLGIAAGIMIARACTNQKRTI